MLTYDQFTARIAVRGGSVASTSGASTSGKTFEQPAELDPWLVKAPDLADWDPDQPLLLANLWETYDVYVNLARTGLWFDINPFWHPKLACYYLRCEPEKKPSPRRRGATMEPREPKRRTVAVPVAAGPATVTAGRLRELCALGEEWRLDLAGGGGGGGGGGDSEAGLAGTRTLSTPRDVAAERGREKHRRRAPAGRWRAADALDAVAVSLAMIDYDGTTVVVQTQRGLVEPEVDEEAEAAAAAAAAARADGGGDAAGDGGEGRDPFGASLDDAAPLYRGGDGGDAIETDDEGDDQPPLDYDTDDFERDGFNLVDDDDDSEPEPAKKQKN